MVLEKKIKNIDEVEVNKIYPSQIFYATTLDPFTKRLKQHAFVAWYSQALDSESYLNNNVYAFRITTKIHNSEHLIEIPSYHNFKRKSYIVCDNILVFNANDIVRIEEQLDFVTWLNVIKERQKINDKEMIQNMIVFSNIKHH